MFLISLSREMDGWAPWLAIRAFAGLALVWGVGSSAVNMAAVDYIQRVGLVGWDGRVLAAIEG